MKVSGKDELQTCARDESCQSDCLHDVPKWSLPSNVCGSVIQTPESEKTTRASSCALNFGARPMNWVTWGVLNISWWKRVISKQSSRGASIRARRSSRYSPTPLNSNSVRTGRRLRACRRGFRLSWSGRHRGDSNLTRRLYHCWNKESSKDKDKQDQ